MLVTVFSDNIKQTVSVCYELGNGSIISYDEINDIKLYEKIDEEEKNMDANNTEEDESEGEEKEIDD